ncbi:hypothetical protein [Sphingobacterium corticibacterium]|uniref:hypothetical protein n=1 Tax=Sphingobacterium corticibacterium TaxID=2484746 RepID=UPI0013EE8BE9|nr:hypothetical protein [Sphingobacterium corticibacterium]
MRVLSNTQAGTLGGTICSVWNSFDWSNLLQTILLAAVGALVSYGVSRLLDRKRRRY